MPRSSAVLESTRPMPRPPSAGGSPSAAAPLGPLNVQPLHLSPAVVFGVHAALFCVLVWWSWLKWPDPLIDFGRELYVPWQITRGKVLFHDIESLFGPLSPYVNALWFRLFGVSLLTLVVVNLAVLAGVAAGVHRLVCLSTDRLTATVASLVTLALFGFLQLTSVGNYNFVTPYSHEATHGIALSIVVLLASHAAVARRRVAPGAIAGFAFGLVLLTKPEISVAAAAAVIATGLAAATLGSRDRRLLRTLVPLFAGTAAAPPLLFFAYFRQHMDAPAALGAIARGWTAAFDTSVATSPFYVTGMGLDRPVFHAVWMVLMFGAFVTYVAAIAAVCAGGKSSRGGRLTKAGRVALVALAPAAMLIGFPRALPLVALASAVIAGVAFVHSRQERRAAMRFLALLMWCTFALVLLAKLGLNARFHHYGFYLALPAATVVVVILCWLVPLGLGIYGSADAGVRFRRLATAALAAALVPYLAISNAVFRTKTVSIDSGSDRFLASQTGDYGRGIAVRDALRALESRRTPGDRLAVLPEGVMLNYLARLDSPLRVVNLMPPELRLFGEDEILRALRAEPPRFVLLVHKDMSEYGYPLFGTDVRYGRRTYDWIISRYRTVDTFGGSASDPSVFSMELFERR